MKCFFRKRFLPLFFIFTSCFLGEKSALNAMIPVGNLNVNLKQISPVQEKSNVCINMLIDIFSSLKGNKIFPDPTIRKAMREDVSILKYLLRCMLIHLGLLNGDGAVDPHKYPVCLVITHLLDADNLNDILAKRTLEYDRVQRLIDLLLNILNNVNIVNMEERLKNLHSAAYWKIWDWRWSLLWKREQRRLGIKQFGVTTTLYEKKKFLLLDYDDDQKIPVENTYDIYFMIFFKAIQSLQKDAVRKGIQSNSYIFQCLLMFVGGELNEIKKQQAKDSLIDMILGNLLSNDDRCLQKIVKTKESVNQLVDMVREIKTNPAEIQEENFDNLKQLLQVPKQTVSKIWAGIRFVSTLAVIVGVGYCSYYLCIFLCGSGFNSSIIAVANQFKEFITGFCCCPTNSSTWMHYLTYIPCNFFRFFMDMAPN
jgi:hypothetical protein